MTPQEPPGPQPPPERWPQSRGSAGPPPPPPRGEPRRAMPPAPDQGQARARGQWQPEPEPVLQQAPAGPASPQSVTQQHIASASSSKGFFASLFDARFDYLVTPKLAKIFYTSITISLFLMNVFLLIAGLVVFKEYIGWGYGIVFLVPLTLITCLLEMIFVRIFMESIIVRFKTVEYLREIRDQNTVRDSS